MHLIAPNFIGSQDAAAVVSALLELAVESLPVNVVAAGQVRADQLSVAFCTVIR